MKTPLLAFLLPLLAASPSRAAAPADPDVCSYLKDVENRDCASLEADALAALLPAALQRKADVAKVYEALAKNDYLEGLKDDKNTSKSGSANTDIVINPVDPPLNERTIPAWHPDDAKVVDVYRRWIAGVNAELRLAKDDKDNPVSEERRRQIDAILANNKVTLSRMKGLKNADEFRCFVGDSCGSRGDVAAPAAAVFTAASKPAEDFAVGADQRPYRLAVAVPGGSLDNGTAPPAPASSSSPAEGIGVGGSGALAAAAAVGVIAFAGAAAWWKKRGVENEWEDAREEVAGQEPKPVAERPAAAKPAGPYSLNGYSPQGYEQKIIDDIVKNADRSSAASIAKYINARTNLGAYGYDDGAMAAEKVASMVSGGQIVFSAR